MKKENLCKYSSSDQCLEFVDCSTGWSILEGNFLKEEGRYKIDGTIFQLPWCGYKECLMNTVVNLGDLEEFCLFG